MIFANARCPHCGGTQNIDTQDTNSNSFISVICKSKKCGQTFDCYNFFKTRIGAVDGYGSLLYRAQLHRTLERAMDETRRTVTAFSEWTPDPRERGAPRTNRSRPAMDRLCKSARSGRRAD
jgi:hypothetical protein